MKALIFFFAIFLLPPGISKKETFILSSSRFVDQVKGGWGGQLLGIRLQNNDTTGARRLIREHISLDVLILKSMAGDSKTMMKRYRDAVITADLAGHAITAAREYLQKNQDQFASGLWTNNPHAHDPDFAKSAEVLGMMYPAMPHTMMQVADPIGHMISSGDGYYAGLYLATITSLAFTSSDSREVLIKASKVVPPKSDFSHAIQYILKFFQPTTDFDSAWRFVSRKFAKQSGCPSSEVSINDDSKTYAAFITMVLLQSKDNPTTAISTVARVRDAGYALPAVLGIIGSMKGYTAFSPEQQGIIEELPNVYTDSSETLDDIVNTTINLATAHVKQSGGKRKGNRELVINIEEPSATPLEKSFSSHYIADVHQVNQPVENSFDFEFEGVGFVLRGHPQANSNNVTAELYLNYKYVDRLTIPASSGDDAIDLLWRFQLPHKKYKATLKLVHPDSLPSFTITDVVSYDVMPRVSERPLQ